MHNAEARREYRDEYPFSFFQTILAGTTRLPGEPGPMYVQNFEDPDFEAHLVKARDRKD